MHKFYTLRDILFSKKLKIVYNSLLRHCIVAWGKTFNTTLKILKMSNYIQEKNYMRNLKNLLLRHFISITVF